ncbi:MAG TPA: hypothetical protein VFL57_20750 [Bryobacteraceae bacterium]|nr:hypothetical protein [Bryobacteraceae bacterium]
MACILGLSFYRAATQSLTTDEAFTWSLYLTKDLRAILTNFDANNHVLFTLLSWLSVKVFGDSEWAIRLPTVLGSLIYVYAACRLTGVLTSHAEPQRNRDREEAAGRTRLLTSVLWATALILNPLVLDFLSAARGYGLATSLFLLSLDLLLRRRLTPAGVAAGLAIAANLSVAMPIIAMALVVMYQRRKQLREVVDGFALPLVVTAFIFVAVPLAWARPGAFYVGADSLGVTAHSLWIASFGRDWQWAPIALAITMAAAAVRAGAFGALFWLTIAIQVIARYTAGILYPELRMGLYLIPLATLVIMRATRRLAMVALALIAPYAVQLRVDHYFEWGHDRNTPALLERLGREVRDSRPRQVVVSWVLEPVVNYYRERLHLVWMKRVGRGAADRPADYYLLLPDDYGVIRKRNLRVLWEDSETRIRVAAPHEMQ